ncbi:hypothetical protein QTN25_008811 [Entamoeba marina]
MNPITDLRKTTINKSDLAKSKMVSSNNLTLRIYSLSYLYVHLFKGQVLFNQKRRTPKKEISYYPISKIVSPNGDILFDENNINIYLCAKERTNYIRRRVLNILVAALEQNKVTFNYSIMNTDSLFSCKILTSFIVNFSETLNNSLLDLNGIVDLKEFQNTYGNILCTNLKQCPEHVKKILLCPQNILSSITNEQDNTYYLYEQTISNPEVN